MANNDAVNPEDINNPASSRKSSDLLPAYHRTEKNIKFLSSTLDQFIQQPQLERLNGFMGSKLSLNYDPSKDVYIDGKSKLRNAYQLEPSLVVKDVNDTIHHASTYDDLINQLEYLGANVSNLDRLFRPESVSFDPCIDWDKFVNFRQYYWMPTGPDAIEVYGTEQALTSVYSVADTADGLGLTFQPQNSDITNTNPLLTFYRGSTYVFNVNSKYPFYIKTAYTRGNENLYENVIGQGTNQVTVIVDDFTPNTLFYFAEGNDYAIGTIEVKQVTENTFLDVEADILNKQHYTTSKGVVLSNGMKLRFVGNVIPESYRDNEFIVEGVGTSIVLVPYDDLKVTGLSTNNLDVNFDATPFDTYPFDDFQFVPLTPDYITINRASPDLNSWSRYNRWVHADVIAATAVANGVPVVYANDMRATRPIIEFVAGLQLYNFGNRAKKNIDLIDNVTKSAFSKFEKSLGFYIDGIAVENGYRVIFNADTDPSVAGKIYVVNFVNSNGKQIVALEEAQDSVPNFNESVVAIRGNTTAGSNWWYNGTQWTYGQQKTSLNQAPLFDVFDDQGHSLSDKSIYDSSFSGTKLFGYAVGTGTEDPVLGFPLKYRNVSNIGDYLFVNYFNSDTFTNLENNQLKTKTVSGNYLKQNTKISEIFRDIWSDRVDQIIPIIQFQEIIEETNYIEITSIVDPGFINDLTITVFVNDIKQLHNVDYYIQRNGNRAFVVSTENYKVNDRVSINLYTTNVVLTETGYYDVPTNLTNNPLNGDITDFTFTELSDHVKSMVDYAPEFIGIFPGNGNLRDITDASKYGSRIVSHKNPLAFAHYFLGTKPHNIVDAIRTVAFDYNQYKSNLIRKASEIKTTSTPSIMLDMALQALNAAKDSSFPYNFSDMIAYGVNHTDRTYIVSNSRNVNYNIDSIFDDSALGERAILVYLNGRMLLKDVDYSFDKYSSRITLKTSLKKGDTILISDYPSTVGSFVPPTPTKLGLYPKFKPELYLDDTYASEPRFVIKGHDGSLTVAYGTNIVMDPNTGFYVSNDFRDMVLLEFESRIYNNIKTNYNPDLLGIHDIMPGAFRRTDYNLSEINQIITPDFLQWTGFFGVDYKKNDTLDETNPFTFNYSSDIDTIGKRKMPGYWRAIYSYFYDTDRPHTCPWEMLGFSEKPEWWTEIYGPAPYTNGNLILWNDLELGKIASGNRAGIYPNYARPGLSNFIPVDEFGSLIDPTTLGLVTTPVTNPSDPASVINLRNTMVSAEWKIGDQGPAETAWRRSSYWPFTMQIVMALTKPATYASMMFDPHRLLPNLFGQYKYGDQEQFINFSNIVLYRDVIDGVRQMASGYSVMVIETGINKDSSYLSGLKTDLASINYNLMAKLGGFASKDKLKVTIDAVYLDNPYPGVLIPSEDYQLFFNQSTPIESVGISGMIIQKTQNGFTVRGYDKFEPYFTVFMPFMTNSDISETVGGRSETFINWAPDITYEKGQIVWYIDRYYRVKQTHLAGSTFVPGYYQSLPFLPQVGGATVTRRTVFQNEEYKVPYGTEFRTIQEVYDLILGYGKWLSSKGFLFNEFLSDFGQVSDWNYSAREFLYWTTQNWSVNSVITLSPFANILEYTNQFGVVDNIMTSMNEFSLLRADGSPFPMNKFTISRMDGVFKLSTVNTTDGLYFARLNVIQKEHAIIFNNFTLFNDVVYDISTGYRQRRINLNGFRTANWNGDFFSPGFVFDQASVVDWQQYSDYKIGQVVRFSGNYYVAPKSLTGTEKFEFSSWVQLSSKPTSQLLPNFDYKIGQFEDFYSLDIDNFDASQQAMAQHLTGYTPRPYLNNIIGDATAQYKFYQGYIKEKGTKNPLVKLSKASLNQWQSSIDFNEEWAFRVGYYGGYNTYLELETTLESTKFTENPQILTFVDIIPTNSSENIYYKDSSSILLSPQDYDANNPFPTLPVGQASETFEVPYAGYVRFDDIYATAYNKNSILDIANNNYLQEGSVIWLGYTESGDWDVLRYTKVPVLIVGIEITVPGQSMTITTDKPHYLGINDLISVSHLASGVDQCYLVTEIVSPTEFMVFTTLGALPALPDPLIGLLFAFKSSRVSQLNMLHNVPYLETFKFGELLWIDDSGNGGWAVYKKYDNYAASKYKISVSYPAQKFGSSIVASGSDIVASSPNYYSDITNSYGRVFLLSRNSNTGTTYLAGSFAVNDGSSVYYTGTNNVNLGASLAFDGSVSAVIAGAPKASYVRQADYNTKVDPLANSSEFVEQGLVKISLIDRNTRGEVTGIVITTPNPQDGELFGYSIAYSTTTNKLFVGAPGHNNGSGAVYEYLTTITTQTADIAYIGVTTATVLNGVNFGSSVVGNRDMTRRAISAPYYKSEYTNESYGAIYVYDDTTSSVQIITGYDTSYPEFFGFGEFFGSRIKMSADGTYLVVASPMSNDPERNVGSGVIDIFKWTTSTFTYDWHQRIHSPTTGTNVNFGYSIDLDSSGSQLVVSMIGDSKQTGTTFDTFVSKNEFDGYTNDPTSISRKTQTTFDSGSTRISHTVTATGAVFVYQRFGDYFAFSQELTNQEIVQASTFGSSLAITEQSVYVGAPFVTSDVETGEVFIFDKSDKNNNGWSSLRTEEPLVDISLIRSSTTIDTSEEEVIDYLDIVDPLKGNILETARQELKYVTSYDPAIYSIGINGVNTKPTMNWIDQHVGELWWDLSTVKFVWYEQGDLAYRKNNWNGVFPGCSIDVYEWVETPYLPSEWSAIADTSSGLTLGISGQPKFADNSVMSVKQVYNSVSNSFTNMYYYWVKNKTTVPNNIKNRRISAFTVATQIANPIGIGSKAIAFIGSNSVILANSKPSIKNDDIILRIVYDSINDAANRHTEWLLLQENDPDSQPNALLEKKLFDSLIGHDILGNQVPDPALTARNRYGLEIRPRQTLFVNRFEALRNIIEFANSILKSQIITGQYSFENLEAKDQIPQSTEYDLLIQDRYALDVVPVTTIAQAKIVANINSDGKISSVVINDPGYGYITAPTVSNVGNATFETIINSGGSVVGVTITDSGSGYDPSLGQIELFVRPFTVVVQSDYTISGKWAIYQWNSQYNQWDRTRTQEFDTTSYWNYIDWYSADYDETKELYTTISSVFETNEYLDAPIGSYVKIRNGGDGRSIILRRTNGSGGTFDNNWDIVYSENGTIKILDSLWNPDNNFYSWDNYTGFDQVAFDYSADQELFYILRSLRDDLFINQNKIYWNQLFFKSIRYAFSEQKTLDWAFKTTFISVNNNLGSLDQRPTYKLQNSVNYEQFLQEIKPYHTKIRRYNEKYTSTELTNTFVSDFDLPSYYNTVSSDFSVVNFGNEKLLQYPWKSWFENYTFGVESIYVYDGGNNYSIAPSVSIVTAYGDTGYGATAVAHISKGRVQSIEVTNPGSGYTVPPMIVFNGGGGVASTTSTTSGQLVTAKAYARLGNSPVRINTAVMKFDRISKIREITTGSFIDYFTGDGAKTKFNLTWVPNDNKNTMIMTVNGVLTLGDMYNIEYYEKKFSPQPNTSYTKKYATLSLEFIPNDNDVIEFHYSKDQSLFNALDRVYEFYSPSSGMPGKDPAQLMSGLEYSGLTVDTIPLTATGGWDVLPYGSTLWDNYANDEGYTSFSTDSTSTQTFTITDYIISTSTQVNTYVNGVRIDNNGLVPTLIGLGTGAVDHIEIQSPGSGYVQGQVTATISAPNSLFGVQAYATVNVIDGVIDSITIPYGQQGSGYTETPIITITGDCDIQAYAKVILKSEYRTANSVAPQTDIVIPASVFTATTNLVEFRYSTSDGTLQVTNSYNLDSVIDGGGIFTDTWELSGALGVKPSEIVMDGGSTATQFITGMNDTGFLNPVNSYAPEECVPGQVRESLGITVYTEPQYFSPTIVSKKYYINGVPDTYKMGLTPSNTSSVFAIFGSSFTNTRKLSFDEYTLDFTDNTFKFVSTSSQTGWLSLVSMQLGSIGLIDAFVLETTSTPFIYESDTVFADIGSNGTSTYVTIDGIPEKIGIDYTVTESTSSGFAVFTFYNSGTIQGYTFSGPVKSFSEVTEQIVTLQTGTTDVSLINSPGTLAPFHSQAIVTRKRNGETLRLNPPVTTYYQVSNGQTLFDISQSIVYPLRSISLSALEVYVNGKNKPVPGIWNIKPSTNQVEFATNSLQDGDVIAIVVKIDHEYIIEDNTLKLVEPSQDGDEISITTFANHDPDFIRTERFKGNMTNQYRMQRSAIDPVYVWVSYNGKPLKPDIDYYISTDGQTVIITNAPEYTQSGTNPTDDVVITSFTSDNAKLTAYRIFRDMLGRTHYKRISEPNTTKLAAPLYSTSTTIVVEDASVLTPPSPSLNIPGVVLISGERIEFFTINGNILGQLRRSTLGTNIKTKGYSVGTSVVDQGTAQTIHIADSVASTSTVITTSTQTVFDISMLGLSDLAPYSDQVEVRYGGRLLLKPNLTTVIHDYDASYDSTSTVDVVMTPEFSVNTSSELVLSFPPIPGQRLEIITRKSQVFSNQVNTFIQERMATLPDKYRYEQ